MCDSLIGTLLNIKGKTKDGVKSHHDLVELGIREQLHPVLRGARTYLPPACYTMSTTEKIFFCHCLLNVKVPQGYSSNIKILVSIKELKLIGLKSHDCHVLMQQLLPVVVRGILPEKFVMPSLGCVFSLTLSAVRLLTHRSWMFWRMKPPFLFVNWRCIFPNHSLT